MNTLTSVVRLGLGTAAVLALVASSPATAAPAAAPARSTVTIKAQGTDLSGTVSSPRQRCVTDRKVIVIKVVGTRGGGDDRKFASDLASADGSWSTGTTGTAGRFYAKVKATARCKGDTSPTIRATR
jgi:hypothetical protein